MWYVSSVIVHGDAIIVDGQSISDIKAYKKADNTNQWNPCLPMPFNYATVTINFTSTFRDWYPLQICDYENNSVYYRNEYLFDTFKNRIFSFKITSIK